MNDLRSLSWQELIQLMEDLGEKKFRAKQIYEWVHQKLVQSYDEMTNIPKSLKEKLKTRVTFYPIKEVERYVSAIDGTTKFLFELFDGNVIETVLMKYHHGNSVCISSQVGCRMGCRFCASTLDGLTRQLTVSELLNQIYWIQKTTGERVSNVVVMGTGEPFDNFAHILQFIQMLTDEHGLHISQRNITVSTCGLVPKIYELAEKKLAITLAISLHAPNDTMRKELMPIANKYSIDEILKACDAYILATGRRITFEYSLVAGVNDKTEHAKELASRLSGKLCHVNLIPVNPIKERDYERSARESVASFQKVLEKNHINATVRREMGADIQAACGQLRKSYRDRQKGDV
ncbi:MAG: 23S rRNA (adenine(2503)-C(2))-methyltransferase RlmN [Lachnospiraceae bacterium]|nr:23S rRNA (adenine(2503)-C(2))-methyltransferase RlmN [Lachnospiraceae bacterium]